MNKRHNHDPRIIVALDFPAADPALALAGKLEPARCRVKVGKELFTAAGPDLVRALVDRGFDVFLDLKFHDIPATVAGACRSAAGLGAWMINVHASGGRAMLQAAVDALAGLPRRPLLTGVTVLTSLSGSDYDEIGFRDPLPERVLGLAGLCRECGLDGVVCSAAEAIDLRRQMGRAFRLVTPGIRPAGTGADDQARIMTPAQALLSGVDYLVIGRPITQAPEPQAALAAIESEIREITEGLA